MAVAAFWNVFELKTIVFSYLDNDAYIGDLARCARVHSTWTNPALDVLYRGDTMPPITTEDLRLELGRNTRMTSAIAKLLPANRQKYASRAALLDLSMFNHWPLYCRMFNGYQFPRLKSLIVSSDGALGQYLTEEKEKEDSNWSWLPSTLEYILICDMAVRERSALLTGQSLNDIADHCPDLKRVWFTKPSSGLDPTDLARFFRRIQPRAVRIDDCYGSDKLLTCDVLSALSYGGDLETLVLRGWGLEAGQLEMLRSESYTANTLFQNLRSLDADLSCEAMIWVPQCFPALTSLNVEIPGTTDESILVPISTMTQLRTLVLHGVDDGSRENIPARAFVVLASLSQLTTLRISGVFHPCYVPGSSYPGDGPVIATATGLCSAGQGPESDEDDEHIYYRGDWFTESDAAEMFSGLTRLEELCLNAGERWFPDFLLQTIAEFCLNLKIIEFEDTISLRRLVGPKAPLFEELREMRAYHFEADGISAARAVKILGETAPNLRAVVNLGYGNYRYGSQRELVSAFNENQKSKSSLQENN